MKYLTSNIRSGLLAAVVALTAAVALAQQAGDQQDPQQPGDQPSKQQQGEQEKPAAPVAGKTTLGITVIERDKLMMGWSAQRDLLNTSVKNDTGEKIGKVQDLIVSPDGAVSAAIVGVGGFVGLGKHDVAIPTNQFKYEDGKFTLPGATKDSLKALPEFEYAPKTKPGS